MRWREARERVPPEGSPRQIKRTSSLPLYLHGETVPDGIVDGASLVFFSYVVARNDSGPLMFMCITM